MPLIAVLGSADPTRSYSPPLGDIDLIRKAAVQIGRELARAGYRTIVYTSDEKFLEPYVVRGYIDSKCAKERSIEVYYPNHAPVHHGFHKYDDNRKVFALHGDFNPFWEVSFYQSLKNVDGLILLGGGASTLISGVLALSELKPLVAFPSFGASAKTVFDLLSPQNHLVNSDDLDFMRRPWTGDMAAKAVVCLDEQIARREEYLRKLRAQNTRPKLVRNGRNIVWLSDIHFAEGDAAVANKGKIADFLVKWFNFHGSHLTESFPTRNLVQVLKKAQRLKPDHILITGDLTSFAKNEQFTALKGILLRFQKRIFKGRSSGELDDARWTILPGNHDVSEESPAKARYRQNLGLFDRYFRPVCGVSKASIDDVFPVVKMLDGGGAATSPSGLRVRLVGLDSNVETPVWAVALNARGRIDKDQFGRIEKILRDRKPGEMALVALHHHPLYNPHITSHAHEFFMSLREKDGRALIRLCANYGVSAILHGHYHVLSVWSTRAPQGTHQMAIVGSPSSTQHDPGEVEFLQLREAYMEYPSGTCQGLAVYRNCWKDRKWNGEYVTFLEAQ